VKVIFSCEECGHTWEPDESWSVAFWDPDRVPEICAKEEPCPNCAKLAHGPDEEGATRVFCKDCYFHRNFNDECREDSPAMDEDGSAVWPAVKPFMWCGKARQA